MLPQLPPQLDLPRNLVNGVARHAAGRAWAHGLRRTVEYLAAAWELHEVGPPFQPGGHCAWVAPVRDVSGRDLVLKVGWRHPEAAHETDGLRFWNGEGAVLLHAAHTWNDTSALLLERCVPGTPLKDLVPEPEQDLVVTMLLRRWWREPDAGFAFRPLKVMCDEWAGEFEQRVAHAEVSVDPGLVRSAVGLFRDLPDIAGTAVVLATDLHAGNILAAEREPWLGIDPKPYVGDPAYDLLQHMLNCRDRLAADPTGLAVRLASLADVDVERVRLWLFARCVLESVEDPVLGEVATRLAPG